MSSSTAEKVVSAWLHLPAGYAGILSDYFGRLHLLQGFSAEGAGDASQLRLVVVHDEATGFLSVIHIDEQRTTLQQVKKLLANAPSGSRGWLVSSSRVSSSHKNSAVASVLMRWWSSPGRTKCNSMKRFRWQRITLERGNDVSAAAAVTVGFQNQQHPAHACTLPFSVGHSLKSNSTLHYQHPQAVLLQAESNLSDVVCHRERNILMFHNGWLRLTITSETNNISVHVRDTLQKMEASQSYQSHGTELLATLCEATQLEPPQLLASVLLLECERLLTFLAQDSDNAPHLALTRLHQQLKDRRATDNHQLLDHCRVAAVHYQSKAFGLARSAFENALSLAYRCGFAGEARCTKIIRNLQKVLDAARDAEQSTSNQGQAATSSASMQAKFCSELGRCMACGLSASGDRPPVLCKTCQLATYCSESCRNKDATTHAASNACRADETTTNSSGHQRTQAIELFFTQHPDLWDDLQPLLLDPMPAKVALLVDPSIAKLLKLSSPLQKLTIDEIDKLNVVDGRACSMLRQQLASRRMNQLCTLIITANDTFYISCLSGH